MEESAFWTELRFRINNVENAVLDALGYCDWLLPKVYDVGEGQVNISGVAGFVDGGRVNEWKFTVCLRKDAASISDINWVELLPSGDNDGWLDVDADTKAFYIDAGGVRNAAEQYA